MLYPLLFEANLFPIIWGGDRLIALKGMPPVDVPIVQEIQNSHINNPAYLPRVTIHPFNGEYLQWQSFYDLFNEIIHKQPIPAVTSKSPLLGGGQIPLSAQLSLPFL